MENWGIEDASYFWSLGIFAIFFVILIFLILIYLLLKLYHYLNKNSKTGKIVTDYLEKKLFYNAICRYMIESYMKLAHNTLIFLALQASLTSNLMIMQTIGLTFVLSILLIWPLFVALFLYANRKQLEDKKFKFRFESMYLGNKTDNYLIGIRVDRKICYLYTLFFCFRRLALVLCFFYLKEENYLECIYGLLGIQIVYIIYITNGKPHIDNYYNSLELFNEVLLLLFFYTMLSF